MKKMILLILTAATALVLFPSCFHSEIQSDPFFEAKEKDMLTEEELNVLIFHAQVFASSSKALRLEEKHREIIRNTRPVIHVKYSAPKYGRIEMEWPIASATVLLLSARGKLLEEKQNWVAEILTSSNKGGLTDKELEQRRADDLQREKDLPSYGDEDLENVEGFGID